MVAGADTMLDIMSKYSDEVNVDLSLEYFEGSEKLQFIELATAVGEGAYYLLQEYKEVEISLEIWLCGVMLFVFEEYPEKIFVKTSDNG